MIHVEGSLKHLLRLLLTLSILNRETHHYYSYVCFHTNITRHSFCSDPRSKTLLPNDMLLLYIGYSGTVYHSTQIPSRKKILMKRLPIQRQVCCMQGR